MFVLVVVICSRLLVIVRFFRKWMNWFWLLKWLWKVSVVVIVNSVISVVIMWVW